MHEIRISDHIAPVYYDFYKDWEKRVWVLSGGRISSKGDSAYSKYLNAIAKKPGQVNIYVPLSNTIDEGVFLQTQIVLDRFGHKYETKKNVITLTNGSRIVFKGMAFENKKRKAEAFKGATSKLPLVAVIFDELASLDDPSRMYTIMETHSRQNPQYCLIFNPPDDITSWLFDYRDAARKNERYGVLHTTIYDLEPMIDKPGWDEFLPGALEDAEDRRLMDNLDWQFSYLGEPVGSKTTAIPYARDLYTMTEDDIANTQYSDIVVFGDVGNADATAKLLIGLHPGGLDVFRVSYYDGREKEYLAHSKQAEMYDDWLDEAGLYPSEEYFDSLNYTLEVRRRRGDHSKVMSIKDKPRHIILETARTHIGAGRVRILNSQENQILISQLQNAQTEIVIRDGKERLVVKKVNNRIAPAERQIHAIDALFYAIYYKLRRNA